MQKTFDFDKLITIGSDKWKTAPFRFYGEKEPFFIGNKIEQNWRNVILSGNTALTLVNAKADGLNYLKLFGRTEQNGTPTPDAPIDIVCNNGVLKVNSRGRVYTDGTTETVEVIGKNLYDGTITHFAYIANDETVSYNESYMGITVQVTAGKTYTFSRQSLPKSKSTNRFYFYYTQEYPSVGVSVYKVSSFPTSTLTKTFTVPSNMNYVVFYFDVGGVDISNTKMMVELGTTATAYEPYTVLGTATAEMLLKVGDYQDVQSVLDGVVTRNVGVKVLNGTENWQVATATNLIQYYITNTQGIIANNVSITSTIAPYGCTAATRTQYDFGCYSGSTGNLCFQMKGSATLSLLDNWTSFLANQYNAGTPVIVVYPLAKSTTETVTPQPLTTQAGTNIVEITQASIDNLGLEVSYKAGVKVTITEIQNAQLSNQVTVTIGG